MRIKNVKHHHPLLKLIAGYMNELVVIINEISTDNHLSFAMGRTIEMTVEFEGNRPTSIQPGSRILIDIETGDITLVFLEHTEDFQQRGITPTTVG
jgi:hypothetical protein